MSLSSKCFFEIVYEIRYEDAIIAIKKLKTHLISKNEATNLFGNEKDSSFEGILGNILQSFDGNYLYSTIEEQAAHLLYFIIKNHPFSDGNKRTARIISNAILINNQYCPISFRTVESIEYKKAMLVFYEQNTISVFKKLFIEQFRFAVKTYF